MKKYYGKITVAAIVLVLVFAAIWIAAVLVNPVKAAEKYTNTFMFSTRNFSGTYTYPEVVFVEFPSGNVANKTTGVAAVAETWENNDTTATQHAESDFWTVTTPPLASNKEWVICICAAASAGGSVETDTMECWFYSPAVNRVCDSSFPTTGGGIFTRPTPMQ